MAQPVLYTQKTVEEQMRDAKPTFIGPTHHAGKGLSDIQYTPSLLLPPVNTDIRFSGIAPIDIASHQHAMAALQTTVPEQFNWRQPFDTDTPDIKKKRKLITTPGNQALCGSCWAIAGAGIVGDNFVVAGQVDWVPNLSTTYTLACYPQLKCSGGDPAQLFVSAASGGLVSNHCVDYSWCLKNPNCNGSALKHFKETNQGPDPGKVNLSSLVPSCGCYCTDNEHLVYKIDSDIRRMTIGSGGVTQQNIAPAIKQQIYNYGPVLGGFLVFNNFMSGAFSKVNGGVYLERGVYDQGELHFSDAQVDGSQFKGGHAVAVIGWGVEKNIAYDNGKRGDVPYWYVRNSWTENWADGGYFKMAMYPYNKISQFEMTVTVSPPNQPPHQGGGFVLIKATKPPVSSKALPKTVEPSPDKLLQPQSYYCSDPKTQKVAPHRNPGSGEGAGGSGSGSGSGTGTHWLLLVLLGVVVAGVGVGLFMLLRKKRKHHHQSKRRHHKR